jgi:Ca-activated chloride channel family protein
MQAALLRAALSLLIGAQVVAQDREQSAPATTFKTGVALVPLTAAVRDSRNRVVTNLSRGDFEVLENGIRRPLADFRVTKAGPISIALLFDTSGSMAIGANLQAGKGVAEHILSWMRPHTDTIALFTFDKAIRQDVAFTTDANAIRKALDQIRPSGLTSLYDAIAKTAKAVGHRSSERHAIVVITDGVDTSSTRTAPEVSALASSIDVPVYVIAVVSPVDHPGDAASVSEGGTTDASLSELAYWTGGTLTFVSAPAHASVGIRDLVTELRQQYLLAIESSDEAGWHRLQVRTRRRGLTVRTRAGYFSAGSRVVG